MIKCLFKGHDWANIPIPTNPDHGKESPGIICISCGKVRLNYIKPKKETREEKAKKLYIKHINRKWYMTSPNGACRPPGPYSPRPKGKPPRSIAPNQEA